MTSTDQKITGILLAGGKSSRMGKEKGFIKLGDRMLYQYPLRVLESLCDEILISTCKDMEMEEEYEQVCDEQPGLGPIGGIYTCLKKSSNDINIVLSYDLPLVNAELFNEMMKWTTDRDIVVPAMSPDKPEPLCGIYHKDVLKIMADQIASENYAVNKILSSVNTKILHIKHSMNFYKENLFLNVNRLSDLQDLSQD